MVTELAILSVKRQQIKEISQKILDLWKVSEVFSVTGGHDLVAIVQVINNQQIADTIAWEFKDLDRIIATENSIAFNTDSRHDQEHMFSIGE